MKLPAKVRAPCIDGLMSVQPDRYNSQKTDEPPDAERLTKLSYFELGADERT
jgi:hypothetical protein